MLGLGDRLYTFSKRFKTCRELDINWRPEVLNYNGSNTSWFCFVPRNVAKAPLLRRGIIPTEGDVFIYKIYALDVIKPNPKETINNLQEIYNDALERMQEALQKGHSLNVLGVSLGNVLAVKAAGNIDAKVNTMVSIVGGGKLGLSAWDSILTGAIARQSGCVSAQEYEEELSVFSPVNYIYRVMADRTVVRLGTHDLLIPFKHGQELARSFSERSERCGSKLDYREYRGADHSSALFLSAISRLAGRNFN